MNSKIDPLRMYHELSRVIEAAPDFATDEDLTQDQLIWVGRAHALVESIDGLKGVEFDLESKGLTSIYRMTHFSKLMLILHKVLGKAELAAPAGVRGSFIPIGAAFDAYASIAKILKDAKKDVLIVDPYMDETVITEYASLMPVGVAFRILSDEGSVKPSLQTAVKKWGSQHSAPSIAVRLTGPKELHDRAIIIDSTIVWTVSQSIKDLAKRSPASIVRADDIAALKVAAYEQIWNKSKQV